MEDTEWNDILRQRGIIPEKLPSELEISEQELEELVEKALEEKYGNNLENKDLDELDDLEDEEDDRVLESYRQSRLAQLKEYASRPVFGAPVPISKPDYETSVTNASNSSPVVLHLYQTHIPASALLSQHLSALSKTYPTVKFCICKADMCIENYPDKNVPTVLIYLGGKLTRQVIGLEGITGRKAKSGQMGQLKSDWDIDCSLEDVDRFLRNSGVLDFIPVEVEKKIKMGDSDDVDANDDEEEEKPRARFNIRRI
ncbi:Phosducin-like protein 3 [Nowakowskiella sp. JEL0407]|nr:Phosducin-like protein 3 [Nowakowskiella sp. JEL0407]